MLKLVYFSFLISTFLYAQGPNCWHVLGRTIGEQSDGVIVIGDTSRSMTSSGTESTQAEVIQHLVEGVFSGDTVGRVVGIGGMDERGVHTSLAAYNARSAKFILSTNISPIQNTGGGTDLTRSLIDTVRMLKQSPGSKAPTIVMVTDGESNIDWNQLSEAVKEPGQDKKLSLKLILLGNPDETISLDTAMFLKAGFHDVELVHTQEKVQGSQGHSVTLNEMFGILDQKETDQKVEFAQAKKGVEGLSVSENERLLRELFISNEETSANRSLMTEAQVKELVDLAFPLHDSLRGIARGSWTPEVLQNVLKSILRKRSAATVNQLIAKIGQKQPLEKPLDLGGVTAPKDSTTPTIPLKLKSKLVDLRQMTKQNAWDLQMSPNGSSFLVIGQKGLEVWETGTSGESALLIKTIDTSRPRDFIEGLRFLPGGDKFVTIDYGGTIKLISSVTGQTLATLKNKTTGGVVTKMELSPDGTRLIIADVSGDLRRFEIGAATIKINGGAYHGFAQIALTNVPHESIQTNRSGDVLIVDTLAANRASQQFAARTLDIGQSHVRSLTVSPNGQVLYVVRDDGGLVAINVPNRKRFAHADLGPIVDDIVLSPDGKFIRVPLEGGKFRTYSAHDLAPISEMSFPDTGRKNNRIGSRINPVTGDVMAMDLEGRLSVLRPIGDTESPPSTNPEPKL